MIDRKASYLQSMADLIEQLNKSLELISRLNPRSIADDSDTVYIKAEHRIIETIALLCTASLTIEIDET